MSSTQEPQQVLEAQPVDREDLPLYDYQEEAVQNMLFIEEGGGLIIILPTGAGKSLVASRALAQIMKRNVEAGDTGKVYIVVSPRLLLAKQLGIDFGVEITAELSNNWLRYNFNSDSSSAVEEVKAMEKVVARRHGYSKKTSLTGFSVAQGLGEDSLKSAFRRPAGAVFISTTYKSWAGLIKGLAKLGKEIDTIIFDEAYVIPVSDVAHIESVQSEERHLLETLECRRKFFFTATPAVLNDAQFEETNKQYARYIDYGMNNRELYGEPIAQLTDRDAVDKGRILRVRTSVQDLKDIGARDFKRLKKRPYAAIPEIFRQHEACLAEEPGSLTTGSLLVTLDNTNQVKSFIDEVYPELRDDGVEVFVITSDPEHDKGWWNGERMKSREVWLRELKKATLDDNRRVVTVHIAILKEGIDVSGFTGWSNMFHPYGIP